MDARKALLALLILCVTMISPGGAVAGYLPAGPHLPTFTDPGESKPVTNWFQISPLGTPPDQSELHTSVAYNAEDQEYLVWDQNDGLDPSVYGQRITRDGMLIGPKFLISPASGFSAFPDVAYNPTNNEYLVVYEIGGPGIYGWRIDQDGNKIGSEVNIVSDAAYVYLTPQVAFETDTQKYLVTWIKRQGTAFSGVEARSLNVNASSLGSVLEITGLLANVAPDHPDVACLRTLDECLVVWHKWYNATMTDHDVNGQRVHMQDSAHLEGSIIDIFVSSDDEGGAAVAGLVKTTGIGQYLVTADVKNLGQWKVFGQRLTDSGYLDGSYFLIAGNPLGTGYPGIASKESKQEYLVAWQSNTDIFARIVKTDASMEDAKLAEPAGYNPNYPAIASGPMSDYLVIEQEYTSSVHVFDVYGYLWGLRAYLPAVQKTP